MNKIGCWREDRSGLPCFEYTGSLPYQEKLKSGTPVKLPEDPWFLLGNYRMTVFTHVSGMIELISGQRSWMRLNQGEKRNTGVNNAVITVNGRAFPLVGMDSLSADPSVCSRTFGCGFAEYHYEAENVTVIRNISVKPSSSPYDGYSGILLTIRIRNRNSKPAECRYQESIGVCCMEIRRQGSPEELQPVRYQYQYSVVPKERRAAVIVSADSDDPLLIPDRGRMSIADGYPPMLFIQAVSEGVQLSGNPHELTASDTSILMPGEEAVIRFIFGFSHTGNESDVGRICNELTAGSIPEEGNGAFCHDWLDIIPAFAREKDQDLRREMRWHACVLEAMATYSEYYDETKIPQGTIYDYDWGCHASARDNYQHALPLVYFHPELAKSVLRYMLKRTTPFGEIRLIEYGYGYADNERYFTSDQQLYFFLLLAEYLRVTKNYSFLDEMITPYPVRNMASMTVAELTEQCFVFLKDTINVGPHGLVRLLNSDWNDAVYYIEKVPYNNVFLTGESHMNSAMAVSILQFLIPLLKNAAAVLPEQQQRLERLTSGMTLYRNRILQAFLKDLGGRAFPRRMYFNGKPYGEDNMFLEPQGFTLQIHELSRERKELLYHEMKRRLYNSEILGAREQENPEFDDPEFDKGSRENGGFWWALNGPVIIAVAQFDLPEARRLLKQMTLHHLSEEYPQYWSSWWSAADQVESSLIPQAGLPDQSLSYADIPVFCAHPHAWILYAYYRIMVNHNDY